MLVQSELPGGAGDNGQIISLLDSVLPEQRQDALQYLRAAKFFLDRQQPDFAHLSSTGQVGIEFFQLLIEREWAVAAYREHAGESPARQANQVGIFRVE